MTENNHSKNRPEILAEITLHTTSEGGRNGPILKGEYRGVLGVGGEHFSARFLVAGNAGDFELGQTRQIEVQFLLPAAALPCFPVSTVFTVWEGKIIGKGKVIKVFAPES